MVCERGKKLRYTTAQRNFESGLVRYKKVLNKEKKVHGVEKELSKLSHRVTDPISFVRYLTAKAITDVQTSKFYQQKKWRGWRFRIYCKRKSSEHLLLNRIEETFGSDCIVYYGDWSKRDQMRGCDPSPTIGIKKLIMKRFETTEVDEFRTSAMCHTCRQRLSRYKKRDGRMSHSRLCCMNCNLIENRLKQFTDRDENAARNILLVGISTVRPTYLARSRDNPPVGSGGTSTVVTEAFTAEV